MNPPPTICVGAQMSCVWGFSCIGEKMSNKRKPLTAETKRKISTAIRLHHKEHPETGRRIGKANKGRKHSEKAKRNMSKAQKGRKHSEETKRKISVANKNRWKENPEAHKRHDEIHKGRKCSEASKRKMGASQKRRFENPEERRKTSDAVKKSYQNPEVRKRHREGQKGRKHSKETKRKIGAALKGNKHLLGKKPSKESKRKMSLAHKKYYENNPEAIERLRKSLTGNQYLKGYKHTEKAKRSMSKKLSGELNPAFNNWASRKPYGKEFSPERKESIRTRQYHMCADENDTCNLADRILCVHHIDMDKNNSHPSNLIALCLSHHMRSHNEEARTRHTNYNMKFND